MACVLTQGHTRPCRDSVGGVAEILITELSNKALLTDTAGLIDVFTLNSGTQFWTYEVDDEDGELVEVENNSQETGTVFYEQTTTFTIKQLITAERNEIRLLAQNRLMIIIKDNNGKYWLSGETRGANKAGTNEARTGKAMGDINGYNLSFVAKEVDMFKEVDASLISVLIVPAV